MIENIHKKLEKMLTENLLPDEKIQFKLSGSRNKQALVCTDRRVLILKTGFFSGGGIGFNQFIYSKITSADVKVGFLGAYFELGLGGNQNRQLSLYTEASQLPNCITLESKKDAGKFRNVCTFILQQIEQKSSPLTVVDNRNNLAKPAVENMEDIIGLVEKLAILKEQNILTEEEFQSKKAELLKRI